ncbi:MULTISPECIES: hypothetical protein [Pseudomonas]|uniref:hypothetical protein n=1 Tax=Pseudomonas TaxID=286 RepID=UPI001BEA7336|nr:MULTISPECIES: hypothetical protein [Pseudomonas]MBT2338141.1 hypothetical protein [Pseudomonas fluorescens]MCD4527616.1 hypothetical protein [Pseudomonas sp. C3-2018]
MKTQKRKAKLILAAECHAEARRSVGGISASQIRFLKVAATCGKEMEPAGLLAGARA